MSDTLHSLRHLLATLAYRGGKVIRDAPERFGKQSAGEGSRTAVEILAHMCDVLSWGTSLASGHQAWDPQEVDNWHATVERFHRELAAFDAALVPGKLKCEPDALIQGPLADCLTHVGQIALLRGVAGSRILAENYSVAAVELGRVGPEQEAPEAEF
jgi:hypothetical protein